jgi:hypothetical protein
MVSLSQELLREFPAIEPLRMTVCELHNIELPEVHVALEGSKGPPAISFPAPISDWERLKITLACLPLPGRKSA